MNEASYFDFTAGKSALFVKDKRSIEFETNASVLPLHEENGRRKKISFDHNGFSVITEDGVKRPRFLYKRYKYQSRREKWPVFHVTNCKTVEDYGPSSFWIANKMPVTINDQGTLVERSLNLCKNCRKSVFKTNYLFNFKTVNDRWYDVLLDFVANQHPEDQSYTSNGYLALWPEISTAYRESVGWRCEGRNCNVDLSKIEDRVFLHTHHLNGKKDNRRENLQALCLLCHAMEHKEKMLKGTGAFNVSAFVERNRDELNPAKVSAAEQALHLIKNQFA